MKVIAWAVLAAAAVSLIGCGSDTGVKPTLVTVDVGGGDASQALLDGAGDVGGGTDATVADTSADDTAALPDNGPAPTPKATLSSAPLDFGMLDCGAPAPASQKITLGNSGNAALTAQVSLSGSQAFTLASTATPTVDAGKSVDIEIAAVAVPADVSAGTVETATLTVTTNDPAAATTTITIKRTAAGATIALDPATVSFGEVPLGANKTTPVKLTNTGNKTAAISVGAASDPQFTLTWSGAPSALGVDPGATLTGLSATFKPTTNAAATAKAAIVVSGAVCGASLTSIALNGQGQVGVAGVSGDLDFGANACGGSAGAAQTVTVSNTGNQSFAFTAKLSGGATSPYTLTIPSPNVAAGGKVDIAVAPKAIPATSTVPGNYADTLTITTDIAGDTAHVVQLKEIAKGAILALDVPGLAFDLVPVTTTQKQMFKITNSGSMPAHVTLTATGTGFTVAPTGAQTIAAGATLEATASFAPTDASEQSGSVALTVDAADVLCSDLPAALKLSGTGQLGVAKISGDLDFGASACGAPAGIGKDVTVGNSGNGPFTFSAKLGLGDASHFTLAANATTVAAGGGVSVTVTPKAMPATSQIPGNFADTLTITTDIPGDTPHTVQLAEIAKGAILTLDTATIPFGLVAVPTTKDLPFKLTNSGSMPAHVTLTASGKGFTVEPSGVQTLAAGETLLGTATFAPSDMAALTGSIAVGVDAGDVLCAALPPSIALSGTGQMAVASVTGDLDFGLQACGGQPGAAQKVTISNKGNGSMTFGAALSAAAASPYDLSVPATVVDAGAKIDVLVTPKAIPGTSAVPGNYADTLTITTDALADSPHIVKLAEGAKGAILAVDTGSIPFGMVPVSSLKTVTFKVTNSGNADAHVTLGATGDTFGVLPTGVQTIGAGATLNGTATFLPVDTTVKSGTITVSVNAGDVLCADKPAAIQLTGTGQNGGLSLDKGQIEFGKINCGATPTAQTLKLTNTGNAPVKWFADLDNSPSHYTVSTPNSGSLIAGASVTLTISSAAMPSASAVTDNLYGENLSISTDIIGDTGHSVPIRQTAQGAILAFAPVSLDFGQMPVSTTATQQFQVINTGNAAATVGLAGTNPTFSLDAASWPVAGGTSAFVTAKFAPGVTTTVQTDSFKASVGNADVLCAPLPAGLAVTGQGTSGVVSFAPGALDFGAVDCGTTGAAQQIVFKNTGNQVYHVTPTLGAAVPLFTVTMVPADGTVAAGGGTLTLTVTPKPIPATSEVTPDLYGDTLTLTTDAFGDTPHAVELTQTAHGAILAISTTSINFGSVAIGAAGNSQFSITNSGNAAATLSFTPVDKVTFNMPQAFLVAGNTSALPVGQVLPQAVQTYSDTAMITAPSTVLCKPLPFTSMPLTGAGIAAPTVKVTPSNLYFGTNGYVACGATAGAKTVTVTNQTASSITVNAAMTKGTNSAFTVAPASTTVAAGASLVLTVTPKAIPGTSVTSANFYTDTVAITTTAPGDGTHIVTAHMTAAGAILTFNRAVANFPTTKVGLTTTVNGNFRVHNSGNMAAALTLALSNPTDFALNLYAGTATPGFYAQFAGTFKPQSIGQKNSNVTLSTATPLCSALPAPLVFGGIGK